MAAKHQRRTRDESNPPGGGDSARATNGSGRSPAAAPHAERRVPDATIPVVGLAQQLVLERYAPAAVLINSRFEIVYFCGPTHEYLAQPAGLPTRGLFEMAREGLRAKLRAAVTRAVRQRTAVTVGDARIKRRSASHPVTIRVTPVRGPGKAEPDHYYLVVFEEQAGEPPAPPAEPPSEAAETTIVDQLEYELQSTREDLQANIEELEAANEELRAAHEEAVSVNEELQSANEELESSKEELQSLNEEMNVVNQQLQDKVEALERANNDLNNLLASTDVATVCLDRGFRVKWFSPPMQKLLPLRPGDAGRPIGDFASHLTGGEILDDARAVLEKLVSVEREVERDERCYLRRVLPYRTEQDRIEGVVITFVDVTSARQAASELQRLNETLEQRVEARTRCIQLMRDVSAIANAAESVEQALTEVLERICRYLGWPVGHAHMPDPHDPELFVDSGIWWFEPDPRFESFVEDHREFTFRKGQGVPGEVLATGRFRWVPDITRDEVFLRRESALDVGLRAALCLPVLVGRRVVALLELFAEEVSLPDEPLVEALADIGMQVGRVIERTELEAQIVQKTVDEQQRIGQELHDSVAQQCTGTAMFAETLRQILAAEGSPHAERAARLVEEIRHTHDQVRRLSHGLMPVEVQSAGLAPALKRLASQTREFSGTACELQYAGRPLIQDNATATHLYRIAQEAVQNAVRHGQARHITIRLEESPGGIVLSIRDDGKGMPADATDPASAGFRIMRYRAGLVGGKLSVESREGEGVTVKCVIEGLKDRRVGGPKD